jgi:hypothetical protein
MSSPLGNSAVNIPPQRDRLPVECIGGPECGAEECGAENYGPRIMERKLSIADIILIAGTRIALGAGIGLLLSGRLNNDQRKAAGLALTLIGGLTTIPLAVGDRQKKCAGDQASRLDGRENAEPQRDLPRSQRALVSNQVESRATAAESR